MRILIIILPFMMPIFLTAQGLVFDTIRYSQIPKQSKYNDGARSAGNKLDSISIWSLKPYCPKIMNQGRTFSCVGWSVGYGAMTIQKAIKNKWKGQSELITNEAFSAMYIFNQIKLTDCTNGSRIEDALTLLQEKGDVLSKDFDTNKFDCNREPIEKEKDFANQNRIMDFVTLFDPLDNIKVKLIKTKLSLVENKPVIIGMSAPKSFRNVKRGRTTWFPIPNEKGIFGHAMIVVGFDDTKKAFEVMNSWGEEWGNDGFIWIKYADFFKYVPFAYQISLTEKIERNKKYSAKFQVRNYLATVLGKPLFKTASVKNDDSFYTLKEPAKTESIYQITLSEVSRELYVYALNIDPQNSIKIIFPNKGESGKWQDGVNLYIPAEDSALQFNLNGQEYFVMLFSLKPIPDILEKFKGSNFKEENPLDHIYDIFGEDVVVPFESLRYDPDKMFFNNELPTGSIIPIVLRVDVQ